MGFDKRQVPGPGHYEPRRGKEGGASKMGESNGAFSSTPHGISVGGGASRDYSFHDYAFNNPWLTYPRGSVVATRLANGPAQIIPPSGFAPQAESIRVSAPAHSFGKQVIAADAPFEKGSDTPGPTHYDMTHSQSVGVQHLSTKRTQPRYTIAGKVTGVHEPPTPGPDYDNHLATTIGGYLDRSKKVIFDKQNRTPKDTLFNVPGPGEYPHVVSLGSQVGSTKPTKPAFGFCKAKMSRNEHRSDPAYLGRSFTQDRLGREGPGPQAHEVRMTYKGISLLKGKGRGCVSFTRDKRMRPATSEGVGNPVGPGPGEYKTTESIGKQALSTHANAPSTYKVSMDRSTWNKVYIGREHMVLDRQGIDSPGPIYMVETDKTGGGALHKGGGHSVSFGRSIQRPKSSAEVADGPGPGSYTVPRTFDAPKEPRKGRPATSFAALPGFDFSSELRACLREFDDISPRGEVYLGSEFSQSATLGLDTPGPGAYIAGSSAHLSSSLGGRNPLLPKASAWRFGTAKRTQSGGETSGSGELGPGHYDTPSSLGEQSESRRKTGPGFTVSRGDRDRERLSIYNGQTKTVGGGGGGGKDGPGPQAYDTLGTWAHNSKKKKGPSFTFGKEERSSMFLYT